MEVFSEAERVAFRFLAHRLLCPEVEAGRIEAWIPHLEWMGVNFLLSFAVDSTALCLPWRTSAFCLVSFNSRCRELPKDGPWHMQAAQSSWRAHRKAFSRKILSHRWILVGSHQPSILPLSQTSGQSFKYPGPSSWTAVTGRDKAVKR